eukprot:XP_765823.1 hypothetical protein [Theileria parva strain Muguga]
MTELQSVNYSTLLINELINQFSSSNTTHTPDTNTIESNPTDGNPTDGNTIELLLGKCYGVVYNLIREMCVLLMELREILSHRICYPKIVKGMFLPFTGGTKQMVQLSSSITHLHSQLSSITKSRLKTLFNKIFNRNTRCNNNNNNNNNNSISSNSNNGNVVSYVVRCNEKLLSSGLRIDLKSLESELAKLKRSEVELSELRLKYATAQEELSIVRLNSENYLKELESLKQTNHIQHICTKLFQQTFNKYSTNFCNKEPFANSVEASVTSVDACVPSVDACVPSVDACVPSEDPVSTHLYMCKLMNNVRYLMKMVSNLEDVNGQLRLALQVNRDQYRLAKENEDAIHRNYNDQLVLMSEHITELNNTILNSEYKIAELTQTKVSCPSCGFNNTLGILYTVLYS